VSEVRDGVAYVVQAEPRGVTRDKTLASVGEYTLVAPPAGTDTAKMLAFATAQVGKRYSFLSILSIVVDILTPNWFPAVRRADTWICSALVAESLRSGGWLHNWGDVYIVTPAQLFQCLVTG